ncbi:MAG TPA: flagellar biosynthesis anti-sigma factor FlgM [Bryobacteraceae bacterium]|nr:flagellar biosynthesis anti-sigma factor FlgM [Bryobacteraceae bacterium]
MADDPDAPSSSIDLGALSHNLRKEQEGSPERAAYLEKLRRQIKAGEYEVDADALADKLLESAADQILPDHSPDADEEAK